ncbi:hypothetical protein MSAN_00974800 [Mycena sanguinolenta]|uniref:Uncharacterized protein n=1 Tax=Mycena sanguinolenta TaxID=230812 RepID=A0A8H7DD32_9AGAR|nr:hypothetical protein MSAN_00974800 [Mycena sanguinolenta]
MSSHLFTLDTVYKLCSNHRKINKIDGDVSRDLMTTSSSPNLLPPSAETSLPVTSTSTPTPHDLHPALPTTTPATEDSASGTPDSVSTHLSFFFFSPAASVFCLRFRLLRVSPRHTLFPSSIASSDTSFSTFSSTSIPLFASKVKPDLTSIIAATATTVLVIAALGLAIITYHRRRRRPTRILQQLPEDKAYAEIPS